MIQRVLTSTVRSTWPHTSTWAFQLRALGGNMLILTIGFLALPWHSSHSMRGHSYQVWAPPNISLVAANHVRFCTRKVAAVDPVALIVTCVLQVRSRGESEFFGECR